jgi:hypothetical protein
MQHRCFAMRSSALFTVIVLGIGATASAEPKQEETSGRVRLSDKNDKAADAPRQPSDWVELASPTPAKHGTEFVIVGKRAGSFATLRLDAAKGKTIVRKVKVFFSDGKSKTIQVDTVLTANRRPAFVELGATKPIDRLVITTEPYTSGEYAVYGSSGAGGDAVGSR